MGFKVIPLSENPELAERIGSLEGESFPEYINEEPTWAECFPQILLEMAELQLFVLDEGSDELCGVLCNVAIDWDGDPQTLPGYNNMLRESLELRRAGASTNSLVGIMGIIPQKYQGQGLSEELGAAMFGVAEKYEFTHVLSPVRPTLKQLYPNFSTSEYMEWTDPKGRIFDPWIRQNVSVGAKILGIAEDSISVEASIDQWEAWCEMKFPASGDYVIEGGHKLLNIDLDTNVGRYGEDHVWMEYFQPE